VKLNSLIQKIGVGAASLSGRKGQTVVPPTLGDAMRFPYGPFRFRTLIAKGVNFSIVASTDLKNWTAISSATSERRL
jgi:hypothetical protein